MDQSTDGPVKKASLEDLSKEDLVIKCKNFLAIAQKAKQSKDVLIEENKKLREQLNASKSDPNTELIIKTLTQQKLDLLTSLEELRSQKGFLDNKYREAERNLCDLDTENQGYKRQVTRLTDENENLISQLDVLEKQIDELKMIGLEQQKQLLALEKSNITKDVHPMKNNDSEEVNLLKTEILQLKEKLNQKDKNIHQLGEELISKNHLIQSLETKLQTFENEHLKCESEKGLLQNNFNKLEKDLLNSTKELIDTNEKLISKNDLIKKLEVQLSALEKKHSSCCSEEQLLACDLKTTKESLSNIQKELVSKNDTIKSLETELKTSNNERLKCLADKDSMQIEFEKLKDNNLELSKELYEIKATLQSNKEKVSEELKLTNKMLTNVETQLKSLEYEHSNCTSERNLIENNFEILKQNFISIEKELFEYKMKSNENNLKLLEESSTKETLIKKLQILEEEHLNCRETEMLESDCKKLKDEVLKIEEELYVHKTMLLEKSKEIEKNNNLIDDLNIELHKYRALSDKLHRDVQNSNNKLADNQIVSSGVASDLENANEKLKDKLKVYHGKIVKFAGDIKKLKESKNELISSFKKYTNQVNEWKELLNMLAKKIENSATENEAIKQENHQLKEKVAELKSLDENNKSLKEEINNLKQKLSLSVNDIQKVDNLPEKYALKQSQSFELEPKLAVTEIPLQETQHSKDEPTTKMNHLKSIFQVPRDDSYELVKENEQMCNQITELRQREQKFLMKIEMLQGHVNELNKANLCNEKLHLRVEDLLSEVTELNKVIEHVKVTEENNQQRIKHYEKEIESLNNYRAAVEELSIKIRESEGTSSELTTLNKNLKSRIAEHEEALRKYTKDIEYLEKANNDLYSKVVENETNQNELKHVNKDLIVNIEEYKTMIEKYLKDIDKLEAVNKESNHKIQLCEKRSSELQVENHGLAKKMKSYENLVEKYSKDIKKLEDLARGSTEKISEAESTMVEVTELRSTNEDLVKRLREYEEKMEQYSKDIYKLDELNQKLSKQLEEHQITAEQFDELKLLNATLNEKVNLYSNNIKLLQNENGNLSKEIDKSRSQEMQFAEKTSEEIIKQVNKNKELDEHIKNLEEKIHLMQNKPREEKLSQTEAAQNEPQEHHLNFEDKILQLKRENAELLSEMNIMNQALKERGEVISKQQAYCEDIVKKMQMYESQNAANLQSLIHKEETIEMLHRELNLLRNESCTSLENEEELSRKNTEISKLKCEVIELKERVSSQLDSSEYNYPDSETMSTLSAVSKTEEMSRMKDIEGSWEERYGKLRNLAIKLKAKIRQLTEEIAREQSEKNDLQQKTAKIKQSYQQQIDILQDQVDSSVRESKSYLKKLDLIAKEVSNDKKKLAENEDVISKLKMHIDSIEKEKQNTEDWKKHISAKVQALKRELEANNVLKKEFEAQITKLNLDLEAKDKALKQEIEKHNETKTSLLDLTGECKKQSVLSLEIQDYERSVKDLSQKIEKKQEVVNKLKAQIDNQKANLDSLQEQSRVADENVKKYEEQLALAHQDNELHKRKITELQAALSEKEVRIQDLTYSVENSRMDNEDLSTQLSKTIVEHEKNHSALRQECELYKRKYLGLEESLRLVHQQLSSKEHELEEIQKDYESYKVRAQSVLRQNQSRDVRTEERLKEESASLCAQIDILSAELKQCKLCADNISRENADLVTRNQEITHRLDNTEAELQDSRNELERLSLKHQQMVIEHTETVRGLKLHGDTLAQCYRQQLTEQEDKYHREIVDLQSKIERGSTPPEFSTLVVPSMPREEGEGSESVDSAVNNNARPVPLEKLLSSETEQETYVIKQQLCENEAKVAHLTALLADTEQDLAKHVQMNKVLKEEIRRQERSVEREKHAENLEYLKNVVYKFLTLSHGDERERLVPVLNTILKLSPEETQKLTLVAKGEKSWSNYLPIWKPQ